MMATWSESEDESFEEKNEKEVANMCFMVINELDEDAICHILGVSIVGLRIYESKVWHIILGLEPKEAIKRICGMLNAHGMGKLSAHRN